jgi:ribosomal protein S8E
MHEKAAQEVAETKDRKSYARRFSTELKKFVRSKSFSKYDVAKRAESIHEHISATDAEYQKPRTNPNYNMSTEQFVDINFRHRPVENQPLENLKYMPQHYGTGHTIRELYKKAEGFRPSTYSERLRRNTAESTRRVHTIGRLRSNTNESCLQSINEDRYRSMRREPNETNVSRLKTNFTKTPQLGKSSGRRVNIPTVTFKQFCQESADADISTSDEIAVKQPSEKSTIKMKQVPIVANPYQQKRDSSNSEQTIPVTLITPSAQPKSSDDIIENNDESSTPPTKNICVRRNTKPLITFKS